MGNLAVVHLLRSARTAGFSIDLDNDMLSVKGPRGRPDILSGIRQYKAEIVEALRHPSSAVDHYAERLTKGIEWLIACWEKLDEDPHNEKIREAFSRNLSLWDGLEAELRRVIPEFRGCPIGGCKDEAPVRCDHCAASAT